MKVIIEHPSKLTLTSPSGGFAMLVKDFSCWLLRKSGVYWARVECECEEKNLTVLKPDSEGEECQTKSNEN